MITSSVGIALILNPNAPTGSLNYNYRLPQATLAVERNFAWRCVYTIHALRDVIMRTQGENFRMKRFHVAILAGVMSLLFTSAFAADQKTQDLYKSKCQGCHGADGKASAIGKKLGAKDFQDPDVAKLSEADLAKITQDGKNKMPPYKGKLTDDQINALAKYIKEMK